MINIDNKYSIGDIVYLKTDREQLQRIVFSINITKLELTYRLACGSQISDHYDFEISINKDVLITVE